MSRQIYALIAKATAVLLLVIPCATAEAQTQAAAAVQVGPQSLSFTPAPGYVHGRLTVSQRGGPIVYEQRFSATSAFAYDLLTSKGEPLGDGFYAYELRLLGQGSLERTLSGSFEIAGGSLVSTENIDPDVKQDIEDVPILGDAIVEGSICVSDSTDCLLDLIILESESFDTPGFGAADIKIKDNVPEIWFADTTAEDSDFALTAEDSKFFLRDPDADTLPITVEGGALSDTVYLTQDGRVGVGTTVPNAPFHVVGSSARGFNTMQVERADDITPNIRFRTSGPSVTQNWLFQNNGQTGVFAIRDETGGNSMVRLVPGGPENALRINADGSFFTATGAALSAGGVWQDASSRTLKRNITALPLEAAVAALGELEPVTFEYRRTPGQTSVGFIAEEVPELVAADGRKTLAPLEVVGVLTRVVQDQQQRLEGQQRQLAEQAKLIGDLQSRLEQLELPVNEDSN